MKFLLNCTVLVYLGQMNSDLLRHVEACATEAVVREAGFHLDALTLEQLLAGVDRVPSFSFGKTDGFLSQTDLELAELAARHPFFLVTDDKKLRAHCRSKKGKAVDLPHWIEYLCQREQVPKDVAMAALRGLLNRYNRRNTVRKILRRLEEMKK